MCRPECPPDCRLQAVVTQGLHVALANQYSFVSLLTRQTMMLFLTGSSGLMVASKLSRLVTGRASRLASDVCRSAATLGGAVVTSTSDASDELPPLLKVQFYAGILPALGDLIVCRHVHVDSDPTH